MSDAALQERLLARLSRVPPKVNAGSVQTARQFKEFYKKTTAELRKKALSETRLVQLQAAIDNWYSEVRT